VVPLVKCGPNPLALQIDQVAGQRAVVSVLLLVATIKVRKRETEERSRELRQQWTKRGQILRHGTANERKKILNGRKRTRRNGRKRTRRKTRMKRRNRIGRERIDKERKWGSHVSLAAGLFLTS